VKLDGTAVEAAGVIVGNEGRVYGNGVDHVDVVGGIVTPTQHGLPGAGDIDLLAVGNKTPSRKIGKIPERFIKGKVPIAAQCQEAIRGVAVALECRLFVLIGNEIGAGSLAAHVQNRGVLMVISVENKFIHGAVSFQKHEISGMYMIPFFVRKVNNFEKIEINILTFFSQNATKYPYISRLA
jgi:hypothetical protein